MGEIDYQKLGFKCGLELHFQIESRKLFCRCPSILSENVDTIVKRRLRAVSSEVGEEDIVAKYEIGKNKYALYEASSENSCLVELDEMPIYEINKDALKVALTVCLLLKAKIVDEIFVMRKQVLDFSNTSGFQRTALIGVNGYLDVKGKKIKIASICLEEDAARKIKEEGDYVVYRVDRLGMPLIEIVTEADIKTNEEGREVAKYIGMVVKSTGKMKRGIGSIRQDLNVSIKNGARVEIKGVQELNSIPKVIGKEIERQLDLIKNKKKFSEEVRKVNLDDTTSYMRPMPSAARMYVETDHDSIKVTKKDIDSIILPELISERVLRLGEEFNLDSETARLLIRDNLIDLFEKVTVSSKLNPNFIAKSLVSIPKEVKRQYKEDYRLSNDQEFVLYVFDLINNGNISKDSLLNIFLDKLNDKLDINKYFLSEDEDIKKDIKEMIKKNKDVSFNGIMGDIMKKYKGKVDGAKIAELVKSIIK